MSNKERDALLDKAIAYLKREVGRHGITLSYAQHAAVGAYVGEYLAYTPDLQARFLRGDVSCVDGPLLELIMGLKFSNATVEPLE